VPAVGESVSVAPLLALLVEVQLAGGRLREADRTAGRLAALAAARRGPYLRAAAALARGRVCVATGRGDPRTCLEDALHAFAAAQLPAEVAQTRLELARLLAGPAPEVAITEARAALADFERLPAARQADEAGALLRTLGAPVRTGPKGVGALTKRETEVLRLVGAGLSNPEIAARLFITRKTVETHVGNLLAKLGLRNRAEAAALAAREEISP
jgi:DNA-binding NarL/FixJ family response regulator